MASPHDALFRSTFSRIEEAGPLVRFLLPQALEHAIDWESLRSTAATKAGPDLRIHHADLLFEARLRCEGPPVIFLLEHKSGPDEGVVRQLVRYVVHVAGDSKRLTEIPWVVPVVVQHGPQVARPATWVQPVEDFARTRLAAVLASFHPRLRFIRDDLSACHERELHERPLPPLGRLTLLCLRLAPGLSGDDVHSALHRWRDEVKAVANGPGGLAALGPLSSYLLHVTDVLPARLTDTLTRLTEQPAEELVMSTADRLIAQGRVEGRVEGQANTLLRLLEAKFGAVPEDVRGRVRSATLEDLDRWTMRVLDAKSLADVFQSAR